MELLEQVESYLARSRVPASTFGRMAIGDPRLVRDLRLGRTLRLRTQERVRNYLTQVERESSSNPFVSAQSASAKS